MQAKSKIKDLFTENDGVSICTVRTGLILAFVAIMVFTIKDIWAGQSFMEHAKDWISGMAEFLGLGGAAVAGKNYTEKE